MADIPTTQEPLTLWLTDRTRYLTGTGRCGRQRYLSNHFGPAGYGIVRQSDSLPLATGKYVHEAFEILLRSMLETDQLPSRGLVRQAITAASEAYGRRIAARGYAGLLQSERSDYVIREQQTLLAGLVWAAYQTILPWLLQEFRIRSVETESIYVLDCSCGLSSAVLDARQHDARGCQGVGLMLRQDLVAERRVGSGGAYFEIKTTGSGGDAWAEEWETKPQLGLGSLGIKERLGLEITETYVIGLYKGRRTLRGEGADAIRIQDSPLCYGYSKPANPPLAPDDWLPAYRWTDDFGNHTASRAHQKRGIWELTQTDWPVWLQATQTDPTLSPSEFWATFMPESVLKQQVFLVGPMNRQDAQIASLKEQIVGEEHKWRQTLWELYGLLQVHPWTAPDVQLALDRLIPASWDCRRYGKAHECEYVPICFKQEGWQDPIGSGKFVARRPHHDPELAQAVARGLLPDQGDEGEEED